MNVDEKSFYLAKKLYDRKKEIEQKRERLNSVVPPTCCIYPRLGCKKKEKEKNKNCSPKDP